MVHSNCISIKIIGVPTYIGISLYRGSPDGFREFRNSTGKLMALSWFIPESAER